MSLLIFIVVLAVLILVHELGHFWAARQAGVRVDEFGIGFPPRLLKIGRWRGTDFTLNVLPFGGFVKIFGENPETIDARPAERAESFAHRPKSIQAFILAAGVTFNLIFAWLLISLGLTVGLPSVPEDSRYPLKNPAVTITNVLAGSPAESAGLKAGDRFVSLFNSAGQTVTELTPAAVSDFIAESDGLLTVGIERNGEFREISLTAAPDTVSSRPVVGVALAEIGTLKLPLHSAFWEGGRRTAILTGKVAVGLFEFLSRAVLGRADFSQIAGPVGIVGLVGEAFRLGSVFLLQFTAFISINLAIINLLPFPALDGGRLLFVLIETVRKKNISPQLANGLNLVGFLILLVLMLLVTVNDLARLF